MAGNIIITSDGLDLVTSAHTSGPLIALKYFVGVYDYRIDENIHNGESYGTSAIDISAAASYDDTEPFGEIIYNIDETSKAYDLSTNDNWVMFDGTENITSATSTWEVSASIMSKEQQINLYDGVPMKNFISGSTVEYISASSTEGYWRIEDAEAVYGSNAVPSETSAGNGEFFSITDYYPVTSGGTLRGSWKCRLTKDIGKVKINKLAIYAVQIDNDGNETSDPVLFAEAMLNNPVVKTNLAANGFDDIIFDVQIQMSTVTANFADVFYSTSGDYWSRTPGGLQYSSKVGVGVFDVDNEEPHTKLDVKGTSVIPAFGIRSNDNDNDYWIFDVNDSGKLSISGVSGDIQVHNDLNISADTNFYLEDGDINIYARSYTERKWALTRTDTIGNITLSASSPTINDFILYCDHIYLSADVDIKDDFSVGGDVQLYDALKIQSYINIDEVFVDSSDYTNSDYYALLSANDVIWVRCDLTPSTLGGGDWNLGSPTYNWNTLYVENIYDVKEQKFYNVNKNQDYLNISNIYNAFFDSNTIRLSADGWIAVTSGFMPYTDDIYDLGKSDKRWQDIYATNASIQTSDARDKTKIQHLNIGLDFINDLEPKSYRWKNKDNGEHYGLIAQELIEICKKHNINANDIALIHNSKDKYGLRYTEFIAPMIQAIQELNTKIENLEKKIDEYKS